MIFELNHENLAVALREYMDRRNIAVGKQCAFTVKTSRKGSKTSRVIVQTVDEVVVAPTPVEPVVEAVKAPEAVVEAPVVEVVQQPVVEEVVETATPFKKLFA